MDRRGGQWHREKRYSQPREKAMAMVMTMAPGQGDGNDRGHGHSLWPWLISYGDGHGHECVITFPIVSQLFLHALAFGSQPA